MAQEAERQKHFAEVEAQQRKEEGQRRMNLAIVNAAERMPGLYAIPVSSDFANQEECNVNTAFREFLKHDNDLVAAKAHLKYLTDKTTALKALDRIDEAAQLESALSRARADVSEAQLRRKKTFSSKVNHSLCQISELKSAYINFFGKIPNEKVDILSEFFQNPQVKTAKMESGTALVFTPGYVLHYTGIAQSLKMIQYQDVSISSRITSELLKGERRADDEVDHISSICMKQRMDCEICAIAMQITRHIHMSIEGLLPFSAQRKASRLNSAIKQKRLILKSSARPILI